MRKRKWALFAFIGLLAFIFISIESWRLFQANERLKKFILQEFRPIVGEQLHISKVHVSFGNIHILDVRLANPAKKLSIDIRDLRIGYNFVNLLIRGFDPQYISQDALFIGPKITLHAVADSLSHHSAQSKVYQPSTQQLLSPSFKELNLFTHISIRDGEIIYAENDSTATTLVHSVQGGIYRQQSDSLFIHLDGAFYNSQQQNMNIIGYGDFKTKKISTLTASLAEYPLAHGFPLVDSTLINLNSGQLMGDINIQWLEQKKRYSIDGSLKIANGAGRFFDGKLQVSDIISDLAVENDIVFIRESHQIINNAHIKVTGALSQFKHPHLNLKVESADLEIQNFTVMLGNGFRDKLAGTARLTSTVTGPLDALVIDNKIHAQRVRINQTIFDHFYANAIYKKGHMIVDSCSAKLYNNHLSMAATIDFTEKDGQIDGTLVGEGEGDPLLTSLKLDSSITISTGLKSTLSGSLKHPVLDGKLTVNGHADAGDSLKLVTFFRLGNKSLIIDSRDQDRGINIHASLDWRQSLPSITAQCDQPQQMIYFFQNSPVEAYLADKFRSSLNISGDLTRFQVNLNINSLSDELVEDHFLSVDASVDRHQSFLQSDGTFVLRAESDNSTRGDFSIENTGKDLRIKTLSIGDELSVFGTLDFESEAMSGSLRCNGFNLSRLRPSADSSFTGAVDAELSIAGTMKAPKVAGSVHLSDLFYNGLGPYESFFDFHHDSSLFALERLLLNFGKSTLFFARGDYDMGTDTLQFAIKGAGFDVSHVLGLTGLDSLVSGEMLVDIAVTGTAKIPDVRGIVAIQNGRLATLPFDEIELKLGPGSDVVPVDHPSLLVEKFRLSRFNVYEIVAHGYYPFHSSDSLYFDINGRGNFLQILNDIDSFFVAPQSICALQSRIRGTPQNPQLQDANLKIENASMDFGAVVAPVSMVRGEIGFDAEEQFVHLVTLEGKMGSKPFRIYNELSQHVVSAKPLDDLRIGETDFHFGVFILETPKNGVPLNFVGIMEPDEYGMLELLGRESEEKFYFGGSTDGITLRGRINLYDTEIMYPFYEGTRIGSRNVKEFLRNLNWDVLVVPTKNTRFVRTFPGAIDQVYIDLKLDENFGGLEFTDRLENETFRINGHVRSTKGLIEYLDMNFRVEQVGVDFDRSSLVPVAYGSAKTTVTDSLGISSNIILTLQTVDNTMDKKSVDDIVRQEESRARFNQIRFKLSTDNPNIGSSEAQIMASLGYSANNLQNSALSAIGYGTDNLIFRPLFRPVEKELEHTFGLDYVRFSSQLTKNIIMFNLNNNLELNSRLALLESTKIIVGKYLADRFFLQYTGQIESGIGYRYKEKHIGLHHTFGLEYQINAQLLVELEYDYDSLMLEKRDDKRIILRHWFPF
ncbi:hypothetical protein EH223_03955 [candidate division KSB1 bacterium]|nr:translocation/assembly module TamB domain-containing protein [candidate division KSB1 bacterium]RQW05751.1 MAG: hypothetical protein EH223_03955 [candidate division KSB1 bacterium]